MKASRWRRVKHHLRSERTTAYGVEYDEERAWHAKTLLDHSIHGDLQDCTIGRRQFGLLWLNPPYGDLETRILTDRFVPVIRAIDFTPGSASFGQIVTIR